MRPKYTFILSFRNRDLPRVAITLNSIAQQTIHDFELVFVDYGSVLDIAKQTKQLINTYSFANYIYADTCGWFWNRAHALNIGLKMARGQRIIISDIDLILEKNFLQKLEELNFEKCFFTFSCFYLPENFNFYKDDIFKDSTCNKQNYIGLCVFKRDDLLSIGGFDEFYMVWGAEDDDFNFRLAYAGVKRIHKTVEEFPILHQWHPASITQMPSNWYNVMVAYCYSRSFKISINQNFIQENPDRPVLNLFRNKEYKHHPRIELSGRLMTTFLNFWLELRNMQPGEVRWFEYLKSEDVVKGKLSSIIDSVNRILDKQKFFNYRFVRKESYKAQLIITFKEVDDFIKYFVGVNRHIIYDYYYHVADNQLVLVFMRS